MDNMLSNDCLQHIQKWYYIVLFLIFVILAGLVMIFRYFLRINKDGVVLKQKDREHEHKHNRNEERIKKLEDKNGHEQHQIDELKKDNGELKDMVIKLQERIINREKGGSDEAKTK
jgi:predicted Holliday junction resolvase-like endonuclease